MTNGRTPEQLARVACDILESRAQSAVNFADAYGHEGRVLVIDGSMFSPSTRAIPYAEQVWDMDDPHAYEVFDEIVVDFTDSLELTDPTDETWSLAWDEGCLFAIAPTYED